MFHQMLSRLAVTLSVAFAITATLLAVAPAAHASINWDAEAGTQWWFDPVNWDQNGLNPNEGVPPISYTNPDEPTDAQINIGGPGVVYDWTNDPNFPPTGPLPPFPFNDFTYPIWRLYMGRVEGGNNPAPNNLLTINNGILTLRPGISEEAAGSRAIIGRSSGTAGVGVDATVIQNGGSVYFDNATLDLGGSDTSHPGYGNGTWDYRGGTLDVISVLNVPDGDSDGEGLRLSAGEESGNGGQGRFIMHNPADGGHVRVSEMTFVSRQLDGDGVNTGVGIAEFHYENGGTRAFQVENQLYLNNGDFGEGMGTGSARIKLVLDEAPNIDGDELIDLPLFDVGFGSGAGPGTNGGIAGKGSLGQYFSSADGSTLYTPGSIIQATYGNILYEWTIDYDADIVWDDPGNSVVDHIGVSPTPLEHDGDIVLRGLDAIMLSVLVGDYNEDGKVNAADYTVWQDHLGAPTLPNRDPLNTGPVDLADLDAWRHNFGYSFGSGSGSGQSLAAVPEPATMLLLVFVLPLGVGHIRRRSLTDACHTVDGAVEMVGPNYSHSALNNGHRGRGV